MRRMEEFPSRRNGAIGCDGIEEASSSTTILKNSEIDFDDVFGGPPRRYSFHKRLHGSSVSTDLSSSRQNMDWWKSITETPVFGDECLIPSRRRYPSEDFFSDIFTVDDTLRSCLMEPDRGSFSSAPDSRVLSPNNPLLPTTNPFVRSSGHRLSRPTSNLLKESEFPRSRSLHPSPSKSEANASNDINNYQFHFANHKCTSKGIPLIRPHVGRRSRLNEKGMTESCPSSNGVVKTQSSFEYEEVEKNTIYASTEDENVIEQSQITEDAFLTVLESESDCVKDVSSNVMYHCGEDDPFESLTHESGNIGDDELTIDIGNGKTVNKLVGGKSISKHESDVNSITQSCSTDSEDFVVGERKLKGNVRNFVNFFNQKTASSSSIHTGTPNQCSRLKNRADDYGPDKLIDKRKVFLDPCIGMDEKIIEKGHPLLSLNSAIHKLSDTSLEQKNGSTSVSSRSEDPPITEESFQKNVVVLTQDECLAISGKDHEDIQALDGRIQKWFNGKEGNIRSLLSTLQFVLWAESGWTTLPLVDIIDANAVKRAYQKALLFLHPDKLQQKGASFHEKYAARRILNVLQEAWIHFNSLNAIVPS